MANPHENWFFREVAALAERFGQSALAAREAMKTPCELADASPCLNDAGTELVVQGDLSGYCIEARTPWPFDDLTDPVRMLIRGMCERQANSRDAGCRLIHIVARTTERRAA